MSRRSLRGITSRICPGRELLFILVPTLLIGLVLEVILEILDGLFVALLTLSPQMVRWIQSRSFSFTLAAMGCTDLYSRAVHRSVQIIFERQIEYMSHRFGLKQCPLPQLPVIPLGVDSSRFVNDENKYHEIRKSMGLEKDEIVVLYVGRLSFHAKANPCPMYQAIRNASRNTSKRVVLIECGWFHSDYIEKSFIEASEYFSPSLRILRVDGRQPKIMQSVWRAADIFVLCLTIYKDL